MSNLKNRILKKLDNLLLVNNFKIVTRRDKTVLEEKDVMSIPVKIFGEDIEYLLYKFDIDHKKCLFPYFNQSTKGATAMCDYILFCTNNNSSNNELLHIILIELKKAPEEKKAKEQLNAGECFSNFIISTLNRINGLNISIKIKKVIVLKPTKAETGFQNLEEVNGYYRHDKEIFTIDQFIS
ncbi:MAG: hypothetical protein U0L93_08110 [Bacteroidales bacterium]|nr:hypothetical protein [Bacteroidales bacterium]